METIKLFWKQQPLKSILILALFFRLIATIFSSGYAMHDDHFLVVETPSNWADDYIYYSNWLPWHQEVDPPVPQGHSFFYPGLHYVFFEVVNWMGIDNPKTQMVLVRLIHALLSLWTILISFKITEKLSSSKVAKTVGLAIALGWAMPFYSVRNLVEIVCIPFYLYGIWQLVKHDFKDEWKTFFIAGLFFGIAFSVRLQMAVFYLGFGFCLLLMKKWKGSISLIIGFGVGAFFTQGIIDYFIWDKPFAELIEYIRYNNSDAKYDYGGTWQWYKYLLVLCFFVIPIVGLFWLWGVVLSAKKYFWLSVPLVLFIVFHTLYPNQQERFIFPMIPVFVILGVIGWEKFRGQNQFWIKRQKLWKGINGTAWTINFLILILMSTYATKQAKVNSAHHFYQGKAEIPLIILQEDSFGDDNWYEGRATLLPKFYAGNGRITSFALNNINDREGWEKEGKIPDYVLLNGTKHFEERLAYFRGYFPEMEIEETYVSSPMDRLLHYMNPKNKNEQVTVIKTRAN